MKGYMGHFGTVIRDDMFMNMTNRPLTPRCCLGPHGVEFRDKLFMNQINIGTKMNPHYVDRDSKEGKAFLAKNSTVKPPVSGLLSQLIKNKIPKLEDKNAVAQLTTPSNAVSSSNVELSDKNIQSNATEAGNKGKVVGGLAAAGLAAYFLMKE